MTRSTHFFPVGHFFGGCFEVEITADEFVELFGAQYERDFVDRVGHVAFLDHAIERDVTEEGNLLADFLVEGLFAPADENLRHDTDLAELGDALLGRFGFDLPAARM